MNMAHPRLLKDPATVNSRIFIGHLHTDELNRNELEDHFSKYGTIVGSSLNRGFGFVQFDTEQAAIDAINNEDGSMFKGRRIDVKPAKKDGPNVGGNTGGGGGGGGGSSSFGSNNDSFNNSSNFGSGGGNNQSFGNNRSFGNNDQFGRGMSNNSFNNDQNPDDQNNRNNADNNSSFGNNRGNLNSNQSQTDLRNQNKNNMDGNMNRGLGGNMKRGMGEMDRPLGGGMYRGLGLDRGLGPGSMDRGMDRGMGMGNMDRDMGRGMDRGMGPGLGLGGPGRDLRGSGPMGGMNRGLADNLGGNFRDRSPLGRPGRMDDKPLGNWEHNKSGGNMRGGFGDFGGPKGHFDDFKGPSRDSGPGFGRPPPPTDYPSIAAEKNDCEIIVVNKSLTEYAEVIESRLKKLGLTVDLLFPNEDVPLSRVLGNIASRGCLYAIVIMPTNMEHRSLTLNILHGLPQEHRNMPVEDAITLIMRDFKNYKSGGRSIPSNAQPAAETHPDAIQVLLNMLADNLQLTVLQYERVIKYLEVRREEQVQFELGEDAKDLGGLGVNDPKQAELQSRILNILNSNKTGPNSTSTPISNAAPSPVPPPTVSSNSSNNNSGSNTVTPSPLLNDPTVQKALDSLLQGNLLKNIGDQSTPTSSATPLFAAFPNMNRF